MSLTVKAIGRSALSLLATIAIWTFASPSQAQQNDDLVLIIQDLEGIGRRDRVETPRYRTQLPELRATANEWCVITTTYDTAPEWIDELTFQYFALLMREARGEPTQYTLFRGSVTYMEIARDRNKQSTVFLRPNTLRRYGDVIGVAVEVSHDGNVVATESRETRGSAADGQEEWWRNPNLTPRDGYILNRSETPFAFVNFDRYETIRP